MDFIKTTKKLNDYESYEYKKNYNNFSLSTYLEKLRL
jgi:hypothetical protein